ncbi:hypothetical protein [Sphingobacterium sp. MYb382]|uniref:hypothetical protein n=1 Tax=Sphingobacterium sp. MYb382 TaxID=2745278 RepID=UPI003099684D
MADVEMKIQINAINLKRRVDRRVYLENHFKSYPEFELHIFEAIEDVVPAVGLYKSLCSIIKNAKKNKLPYVVICEDDHEFTDVYNKSLFFEYITRAKGYNADVLLGGVSWFACGVRVESDLYWLRNFSGTQFLVIYESFYQRIIEAPFNKHDIIDAWMCSLSDSIFVAVPMLSVQRDFGYSDVTVDNNRCGKVEELFTTTQARWKAIKDVTAHIWKELAGYVVYSEYEDIQLPTYVINLARRKDRLAHIRQQFAPNDEFNVHIIEAVNDKNGAVGLWKSILKVVQMAKDSDDEVILICEDDHIFCDGYDKHVLWNAIYQGAYLGADLVLGGISSTQQVIPASDYLCWISSFQCAQFTIVYSRFFETILSAEFQEFDAADLKLSDLTANKYVIHPFISLQKDFGYSDIPIDNFGTELYRIKFDDCSSNIDKIRSIFRTSEGEIF